MVFQDDIEAVKKDWELNRLKALKEEEERRAELEEDEMLYTYSRDDAYQQVKKRNRLLAQEARRATLEAETSLSPRKAALSGAGEAGAGTEAKAKQWVYRTPKIIRDLVKNKNVSEGDNEDKLVRSRSVGDDEEDVDVETVDMMEENGQKMKRPEKVTVKRQRRPKGTSPAKAPKQAYTFAVCSTEATRLETLPGYSIAQVKDGLLQRLNSPTKAGPLDRTNIFEQFGVQGPPNSGIQVGISQVPQNPLSGSTVRLINTPQGRQMVVVNSSAAQQTQTPQNVVLLQSMQGFPQGIVVGNNILSLQGTPFNVAQLHRQATPVSVQQGPRLVGTPQIVNTRVQQRVLAPVGSQQQQQQQQQQQALIQRLISQQLAAAQGGQGLVQGATLQLAQASTAPSTVGHSSIRLSSPFVHTSGGQIVSMQSSTPAQKKVTGQTIASLIAAGRAGAIRPNNPATAQPQQTSKPAFSLPNLANIMRAQVPGRSSVGGSSSSNTSQSQVRVNPAVAKLVASHIHNVSGNTSGQPSSVNTVRASSPAIVNVNTVTRSQSPTVVKVVSVSRTGSPSTVGAVKTPVTTVHRGESPLATINIKGLPPGVSIPASLVNSLVSNTIGMPKGPVRTTTQNTLLAAAPMKSVMRVANPNENNGTPIHVKGTVMSEAPNFSSPVRYTSAVITNPSTPTTMQAWSNPNLVIRTRRAAQTSPAPAVRVPQAPIAPKTKAPSVPEHVASPASNGPMSLGNHVAKNIQQSLIPTVVEQTETPVTKGSNGGVEFIEIN